MKNIRYYIFWTLDFLKGSPIRKHYTEIANVFFNKPSSQGMKELRLSNILQYSVSSTNFYKNFDAKSLKAFPIIAKRDIVANLDAMFSREFIKQKETLKTMITSGSTGTPLKMYQNKDKVRRNHADLLFFYKIGNYNIGDRFYAMRVWNNLSKKSKRVQITQNLRMFDISNLDVDGAAAFVNTMVRDTNPKVLLTYASSFNNLMLHIESIQHDWNIKAIFTNAEELLSKTKQKMLKVFGCPVISRYSNQENGMLAQQPMSGEDYFMLNEASYYFEFLKLDSDEEAGEDEMARIVITDLFNKAIPIIRYDTGDIGTYKFKENGNRIISELIGRKTDFLLNSNGKILSPHIVTMLIWEFNDISQFQFIQESLTEFTLKIVYLDARDHVSNVKRITERLKDIFGDAIRIEIIKTDNIPLEQSGKRKYVISKLKQPVIR